MRMASLPQRAVVRFCEIELTKGRFCPCSSRPWGRCLCRGAGGLLLQQQWVSYRRSRARVRRPTVGMTQSSEHASQATRGYGSLNSNGPLQRSQWLPPAAHLWERWHSGKAWLTRLCYLPTSKKQRCARNPHSDPALEGVTRSFTVWHRCQHFCK